MATVKLLFFIFITVIYNTLSKEISEKIDEKFENLNNSTSSSSISQVRRSELYTSKQFHQISKLLNTILDGFYRVLLVGPQNSLSNIKSVLESIKELTEQTSDKQDFVEIYSKYLLIQEWYNKNIMLVKDYNDTILSFNITRLKNPTCKESLLKLIDATNYTYEELKNNPLCEEDAEKHGNHNRKRHVLSTDLENNNDIVKSKGFHYQNKEEIRNAPNVRYSESLNSNANPVNIRVLWNRNDSYSDTDKQALLNEISGNNNTFNYWKLVTDLKDNNKNASLDGDHHDQQMKLFVSDLSVNKPNNPLNTLSVPVSYNTDTMFLENSPVNRNTLVNGEDYNDEKHNPAIKDGTNSMWEREAEVKTNDHLERINTDDMNLNSDKLLTTTNGNNGGNANPLRSYLMSNNYFVPNPNQPQNAYQLNVLNSKSNIPKVSGDSLAFLLKQNYIGQSHDLNQIRQQKMLHNILHPEHYTTQKNKYKMINFDALPNKQSYNNMFGYDKELRNLSPHQNYYKLVFQQNGAPANQLSSSPQQFAENFKNQKKVVSFLKKIKVFKDNQEKVRNVITIARLEQIPLNNGNNQLTHFQKNKGNKNNSITIPVDNLNSNSPQKSNNLYDAILPKKYFLDAANSNSNKPYRQLYIAVPDVKNGADSQQTPNDELTILPIPHQQLINEQNKLNDLNEGLNTKYLLHLKQNICKLTDTDFKLSSKLKQLLCQATVSAKLVPQEQLNVDYSVNEPNSKIKRPNSDSMYQQNFYGSIPIPNTNQQKPYRLLNNHKTTTVTPFKLNFGVLSGDDQLLALSKEQGDLTNTDFHNQFFGEQSDMSDLGNSESQNTFTILDNDGNGKYTMPEVLQNIGNYGLKNQPVAVYSKFQNQWLQKKFDDSQNRPFTNSELQKADMMTNDDGTPNSFPKHLTNFSVNVNRLINSIKGQDKNSNSFYQNQGMFTTSSGSQTGKLMDNSGKSLSFFGDSKSFNDISFLNKYQQNAEMFFDDENKTPYYSPKDLKKMNQLIPVDIKHSSSAGNGENKPFDDTNFMKNNEYWPGLTPSEVRTIELTYIFKRPERVVYYPQYVKFKIPYPTFVKNLEELLREKPELKRDTFKLYQELTSSIDIAEVSPSLRKYPRELILHTINDSRPIVKAKILSTNSNDNFLITLRSHSNTEAAQDFNSKPISNADNMKLDLTSTPPGFDAEIIGVTPTINMSTNPDSEIINVKVKVFNDTIPIVKERDGNSTINNQTRRHNIS